MGLDILSSEIKNVSQLIELFLYDNKLTYLPCEIGLLSHLQRVWFFYTKIFSYGFKKIY